ncbi:MAG TPA: hypothetical protein VKG89_09455 [Solirubrobacterales bacterium]|nr:hypothetical protein [Solirubrobacterales bacterium]
MRSIATAVLCALLALGASTALAGGTGSYQRARLGFTAKAPAESSGLRLRIDYMNPDDPNGKPVAVRRVVQTLARGARFDTAAPRRCTASDADLMAEGPGACPDRSVVGGGYLTVDTGTPGPDRFLAEDVTAINSDHELIFLTRDRQTGAYLSSRFEIHRRRVVANTPPLPGTPPDGGAIDKVHVNIKPVASTRSGTRHLYVRTPGRCPASGRWTNRIRFTYADGVTQAVTSHPRCEG